MLSSGGWEAYNLVIHELAHKLDMLNGDANGHPPLHNDMRIRDWTAAMQTAYDDMNRQLDADPDALGAALASPEWAAFDKALGALVEERWVHRFVGRENWVIGPEPRR